LGRGAVVFLAGATPDFVAEVDADVDGVAVAVTVTAADDDFFAELQPVTPAATITTGTNVTAHALVRMRQR
jgi:hypothetical protein